jgi:hypothetical protein
MDRLIRDLKGQVDQAGAPKVVDLAEGGASEFATKTHVSGAPSHLGNVQGMNRLWQFLRDKHNQQVLGWLGGGLVVLATGLWIVVVYLFPPLKSSGPRSLEPVPPTVQADCGGVAIGGNVSGSTITGGATTNSDCAAKPK